MDCARVREFLSGYIDEALDAQTKASVDEHLRGCRKCSEELASLKRCIREVSSLGKVRAPEDFLEKVHERLERRFEFEKIMSALFVPMRIKIPLEVAGIAVVVMLFAVIYKTPPLTRPEITPETLTVAQKPKEESPIQLALLVRREMRLQ